MTIIAYRDGVLAADTMISFGGSKLDSAIVKIVRRDDGILAGAAGDCSFAAAFLDWFETGSSGSAPEAKEGTDCYDRGAIFYPDGRILVYEPRGQHTLRPAYYAMGSGKSEALGAFFVGADATKAAQAAIAHDCNCGGELTILRHDAIGS